MRAYHRVAKVYKFTFSNFKDFVGTFHCSESCGMCLDYKFSNVTVLLQYMPFIVIAHTIK